MDKEVKMRNRILVCPAAVCNGRLLQCFDCQFAFDLKMSKSTFYKYFPSKESLLFAVIDDFYVAFEQEIKQIIEDAQVEVTKKVQLFLQSVRRRFGQLQTFVVEDIRRAVPEAYAHIEERRKSLITGTLVHLFEQGAGEGYFRSDIPPIIIANVLLQAIQHLEHPEVISGMSYTFADMFAQVFSVVMEGSLSEKGRERFGGEGASG